MLFSTIGQIHVFLWMVGAGLAIGALYTLFATIRRLLCAGFWLTLLLDALFGLGAGLILIAAGLVASYGQLRLYELMGAIAGFALFEAGIAPPVHSAARAILGLLRRIWNRLANFRLIKVIFR